GRRVQGRLTAHPRTAGLRTREPRRPRGLRSRGSRTPRPPLIMAAPGGSRIFPGAGRLGRPAARPRGPGRGGRAGGAPGALSARTGLGPNVFRTAFVCSSLAGGFGAAVYVLAWLFIPAAGEDSNIASRALADRRGIALAAGAASLLTLILMIASLLHVGW